MGSLALFAEDHSKEKAVFDRMIHAVGMIGCSFDPLFDHVRCTLYVSHDPDGVYENNAPQYKKHDNSDGCDKKEYVGVDECGHTDSIMDNAERIKGTKTGF